MATEEKTKPKALKNTHIKKNFLIVVYLLSFILILFYLIISRGFRLDNKLVETTPAGFAVISVQKNKKGYPELHSSCAFTFIAIQ
jgi:hypothetical protein